MTTQEIYYKAVRPDLTDFTTRKTTLVLGEWMPDIQGNLEMCANGYHVSDAIGEALKSGHGTPWPARLFEVEIRDVLAEADDHKRVCRSYRPLRELPAWQAFGPNGEDVVRFIGSCATITPEQVKDLAAARLVPCGAAGAAARLVAWGAVRDAARNAAGAAARLVAWGAVRDAVWGTARLAAGDVAWDAAWALVVRDLITPKQFDSLTGLWVSVMGRTWEAMPA